MANPRDKLKEQLQRARQEGLLEQTVQREAAQLSAKQPPATEARTEGQRYDARQQDTRQHQAPPSSRIRERYEQLSKTPLTVYLAFDTTDSMGFVINAVRKSIKRIGSGILTTGENIQAAILGVGDHSDAKSLQKRGVHLLGDYGQDNVPTSDPSELKRQVHAIVDTLGWDQHEAYECFAHDIGKRIETSLQQDPSQQYAVILFGDAAPHQKPATWLRQITQGFIVGDAGCKYGRRPEELILLANAAAHTYFVDCSETLFSQPLDERFRQGTYGPVEQHPKTSYLLFKDAEEILPEAIIGMVRKVRGPESLDRYLAQLEPGTATRVTKLLGTGK